MGYFIYLPKIGWFRIFLSREIPKDDEIGEVTVLREADRKIARVRHDFLYNKISTIFIAKSHGLVVEGLKVKNMSSRAYGKWAKAKTLLNRDNKFSMEHLYQNA